MVTCEMKWFFSSFVLDFEKRSIEAAAEAQLETGAPVLLVPGDHREAPDEVMRIFTEAGGDSTHTMMAHLDSKWI